MAKIIVTDLDNTLLSSKKEVSAYCANALSMCQNKGIKIIFATARPERTTIKFQENIVPDYVISNNGATISHKGKIIYNNFIDNDIINKVISLILKIPEVTSITLENGKCLFTNYNGSPWDIEWNTVYNDFSNINFSNILKISTECKQASIVERAISKLPNLKLFDNTGEQWQQIMKNDSLKINAIKYIISNCCSCEMKDVIAFGDDYNDMEMIKQCGVGVAMGNAIGEVKLVSDYVCDINDNDGVGKWLYKNI